MNRFRESRRWQIFGVVISIAWAVGAWSHSHNSDVEAAKAFGALTYKTCTNEKLLAHDTDLSSCESERTKNIDKWMRDGNSTANEIFVALVPIPFLWLAGLILLYFIRVQIAGLRAVVPWTILSPFKKAFVISCAFVSFAGLTFGVIAILNLYVDSKIPVSPSPFVDIIPTGSDFVAVAGTWVRTDLSDDTIANPLQTSRIECNRLEGKCIEATAFVTGSVLGTELHTFDIKSWTQNAVVFENQEMCATEVYTIDFNTKTVSGAGHQTNQETDYCKMGFNGKKHWTVLLSNGFNVYWELRKKARPLPLRLVQTAFGN